jgi:hypothetical protein
MKIPNTPLISSLLFTRLKTGASAYAYAFPVAINADVSV